jgi:hypothetical protein
MRSQTTNPRLKLLTTTGSPVSTKCALTSSLYNILYLPKRSKKGIPWGYHGVTMGISMYILSVLSLHLRQLPLSGWRGWPGGTPRRAVSPDASDPTAWWPKHRAACGMTEKYYTAHSKYLFLLDLVGKCWYFVCLTRGGKFSEGELLSVIACEMNPGSTRKWCNFAGSMMAIWKSCHPG